ncbi:MASE1 domain-containing protein [Streptacidiphilus rugosus]|uniref:MASE1 domain-containing protein n=1 Tax=Streptacidiphilus rugosus TaxID=405783 RepID=UPI0005648D9C|nr:MASE1 domain-containing protein [Streptacidiphilus rugosus]
MPAVARDRTLRDLGSLLLWILAVAALYLGSGRLGLLAQIVVGGVRVTPIWPPTGVAVAALVLLGARVWPGIALGQLLVVTSLGGPVTGATVGIVAGSTVAPLVAYWLLRQVGFRSQLDRLRDGLALVFLGAFAAMLVSATSATLVLLTEGSLPSHGYWSAWSAWWTGDAMGVLVVTPLLLVGRWAALPWDLPLRWWAEAVVPMAGCAAIMVLDLRTTVDVLFLVFPLLTWAALRFQLPVAAPCVLIISVLAVPSAIRHTGPFAGRGLLATMTELQALNGSAALTALLLSAVISERNATHRRIEEACVGLAELVARLAPGESNEPWPPTRDRGM